MKFQQSFPLVFGLLLSVLGLTAGQALAEPFPAKHITIDLAQAKPVDVTFPNGDKIRLELLKYDELRDSLRHAVRQTKVSIKIDNETFHFTAEPYALPQKAGRFWIDCPVSHGYLDNSTTDHWELTEGADLRIRVWPDVEKWAPEKFVYPVRQKWFASGTQMANEPTFVDGGEDPKRTKIYYHSGLDIGGPEGLAEVVAATDATIVSLGNAILTDLEKDHPVAKRYDVIYLRDSRGWYYRYSHLQQFNPELKLGQKIEKGYFLGVLGKEGGSGGWAHLHFEIKSRQPSGRYGTEEGYAFLWEAAQNRPNTSIMAVARPHKLVSVHEEVTLNGSRSWARNGKVKFEWLLSDGRMATSPQVTMKYNRPGHYSEPLKVTDDQGHVSYDFAVTQVLDPASPEALPPSIQASFWPSMGVKTSTPVTFLTRTFRTTEGAETWNFGDGTSEVTVQSDGNSKTLAPDGFAATVHRFSSPGDYLVKVTRTNKRGESATAHLHVHVEEPLK